MITSKKKANGFEYIEIENNSATARIALQGGHLFHYQQHGKKPLLWLSQKSHLETGKAIRGGIPICWPWFGRLPSAPDLPQHGFARTSSFALLESSEPDEHTSTVVFQLQNSRETLALWPFQFQLFLHITVGPTLKVALTTRNCDSKAFTISSALHTYFAVSDINKVFVQGLDSVKYWDALTDEIKNQKGAIQISEEVDRVYLKTTGPFLLRDTDRTVHVTTAGAFSAVVWNPWKEKTKRMADMQEDAYKSMLCIETANALEDARNLAVGEEHTLQVTLSQTM
jgi:glucose-6-phosphate 1-epimerase